MDFHICHQLLELQLWHICFYPIDCLLFTLESFHNLHLSAPIGPHLSSPLHLGVNKSQFGVIESQFGIVR